MSAISKLSISHKQDKIKNFKQEICVPSSENRTELEEKFSYILVGNSLQSHCIRLQTPVLALQPSTAKPVPSGLSQGWSTLQLLIRYFLFHLHVLKAAMVPTSALGLHAQHFTTPSYAAYRNKSPLSSTKVDTLPCTTSALCKLLMIKSNFPPLCSRLHCPRTFKNSI